MYAEERFQAARVPTLLRQKNSMILNYESITCIKVVEYGNKTLKWSFRANYYKYCSIMPCCQNVCYVFLFCKSAVAKFTAPFFKQSSRCASTAASVESKHKSFAKVDEREESLTLLALFPQMVLHGTQQFKSERLRMRTCPRACQVAHAFPACTCIGLKIVLPKQRHRVRSSAKLRAGFSYSGRNVMHCITLL